LLSFVFYQEERGGFWLIGFFKLWQDLLALLITKRLV